MTGRWVSPVEHDWTRLVTLDWTHLASGQSLSSLCATTSVGPDATFQHPVTK